MSRQQKQCGRGCELRFEHWREQVCETDDWGEKERERERNGGWSGWSDCGRSL